MKDILNILLLIITLNSAEGQIITTIAGTGIRGFAGDGGLAIEAEFKSPSGIFIDKHNNLYISDYANNRIRKVSLPLGVIETIAGTGVNWFSGDGGLAINASFDLPNGVIADSIGNIYISDFQNRRIRKINATTGIISTIAGNGSQGYSGNGVLATSAAINPSDMCLDATQTNLYIADGSNNRIRKIDLTTKIITTVAGIGASGFMGDGGLAVSARLSIPSGIFVDSANHIYFADMGNNRIRRIDANTKIISTIVGSSNTGGFFGDGGLPLNAKLWYPSDIFLDKAGNLYIADNLNNRIRFVSKANGHISTIAGNGNKSFSGDGELAINASLNNPSNIHVDDNGILYISDEGNNRIRRVDLNSIPTVYTFTGNGFYRNSANWKNGLIPPSNLPAQSEIIINPENEGECILDVTQSIYKGGKFTILTGKKFTIQGNLLINN